jgi:hypothetical protein
VAVFRSTYPDPKIAKQWLANDVERLRQEARHDQDFTQRDQRQP